MSIDYADVMANIATKNQVVSKGDYIKDGLLYCGKCNTQKQCKIISLGTQRIVPCVCKCESMMLEKKEQQEQKIKQIKYIRNLKANGIQDKQMKNWTFENDNGNNVKNMSKMKRYYKEWESMYKENIGLLLWGTVGTGKSYCAACIANALLNDGVPVLATNFIKIINDLTGFQVKNKNAYIDSLNNYKLLLIDDLGAERQTETAQEIVFNVLDSRSKNRQPTIITTNLTLKQLENPQTKEQSRIYQRALAMCGVPIQFIGESMRKKEYYSKIQRAKELFK